ncbi:heme exporter protein CcmB [Chloroflexota bacterium]
MTRLMHLALLIAWKDLQLELRSRDVVGTVAMFPLVVLVVLHLALDLSPSRARELAPGVFWVAFSFTGVLAMGRSFFAEKDQGSLEGLLLLPVRRAVLYLGKLLGSLAFTLVIEAALVPVFAITLNISFLHWQLALIFFLATLGFAALATIFSALLVHDRSREVMLPLLFFPMVAPVIMGAVQATAEVLQNVGAGHWILFLATYDAVFLVVCVWTFTYVLEE